jgi:hypothetical protein
MITKKELNKAIASLPDKFTLDEVLDRIMLLQKIEVGLEQSKKNEVIPDEELDKHLPGWLS